MISELIGNGISEPCSGIPVYHAIRQKVNHFYAFKDLEALYL